MALRVFTKKLLKKCKLQISVWGQQNFDQNLWRFKWVPLKIRTSFYLYRSHKREFCKISINISRLFEWCVYLKGNNFQMNGWSQLEVLIFQPFGRSLAKWKRERISKNPTVKNSSLVLCVFTGFSFTPPWGCFQPYKNSKHGLIFCRPIKKFLLLKIPSLLLFQLYF